MEEPSPFDAVMKEKAQLLLLNLEQGNVNHAMQELLSINTARNDSLYQQIGKITRGLHDAITNLDFSNADDAEETGGRDVSTRVDYVLNLTRDAANKTMDLADEATPIAAELGSESTRLREDWAKLASRQISAEEFRKLYQRIDDFLAYAEDKSGKLYGTLTDIVVTQGYQDLSGQVLQKIVHTLEATELKLVSLLDISGQMQDVSGIIDPEESSKEQQSAKDIGAEGPLPMDESTLKDQDEVDELLSSLGF
ncbi:MAG: protein phosphatase CheZ [Pseudomonadales bacterium]|nr:protein phosphatase CheZ [Pseudomonadales bacterium]